jgi:hypothetical protein
LVLGGRAMSRMLFVAFVVICWTSLPSKAEVLTLSCGGTMKDEEQEKPHTITKMELIVNFDAGVSLVSQELLPALMRSRPIRFRSRAPLSILREWNGQSMAP